MQTTAQLQHWMDLSGVLYRANKQLTSALQQLLLPNAWAAVQKAFNIMVEVFQNKMQLKPAQKEQNSVRYVTCPLG
jgi:hypothetical protein